MNKLKQLQDTIKHKNNVIEIGTQLSQKLMQIGHEKLSLKLLERIYNHDNTKFSNREFYGLADNVHDKRSLKNVNEDQIAKEEKMKFIKFHWFSNKHHPEYYSDVNDMKLLDILEMCCDWYARSKEFDNDPIEFFNKKQGTRWNFNKEMQETIIKHLRALKSLDK
jgi:hypothetical protein